MVYRYVEANSKFPVKRNQSNPSTRIFSILKGSRVILGTLGIKSCFEYLGSENIYFTGRKYVHIHSGNEIGTTYAGYQEGPLIHLAIYEQRRMVVQVLEAFE